VYRPIKQERERERERERELQASNGGGVCRWRRLRWRLVRFVGDEVRVMSNDLLKKLAV